MPNACRMPGRAACAIACNVLLAVILTATAAAQRNRGFSGFVNEPTVTNLPYDGRFTFARLRFTNLPGGYYYRGMPAWAHGFPTAEGNLMKIVNELTTLRPHLDGTNAIAIDDPALFKYPVAYMTEASFIILSDKEAAALRAYLLKGGFLIFDDFRDNYGGATWDNFTSQMQKVLPEMKFIDLDPSHPIFHSFYDINSFNIVPQYYDRGRPAFRGGFQDNDPKKRMMVMVNFNTDVSNYWEFSAQGFRPIDEANQAFKLGVNYVIYALTH